MWRLWQIGKSAWQWLSPGPANLEVSVTNPAPKQTPASASATPFRPINALGPHYLDLCAELYRMHSDMAVADAHVREQELELRRKQNWVTIAICDRQRAHLDQRTDYAEYLDHLNTTQSSAEKDIEEGRDFIAMANEVKKTMDKNAMETWNSFWKHAQKYMNRCLDVSFSEPWSITHEQCLILRNALDTHKFLRNRQHEVRRRKLARVWTRHQSEKPDSVVDIQQIEEVVRLVEEKEIEFQKELVQDVFEPLLRATGRLSDQSPLDGSDGQQGGSDVPSHVDTMSLPRTTDMPYEATSSYSPVPQTESRSRTPSDGSTRQTELRDMYQRALDLLVYLQGELRQHEMKWQRLEPEHLITFPRSSKTRFTHLVNFFAKSLRVELQEAEDNLQALADCLHEHDITIPQTLSSSSLQRSPSLSGGAQRRVGRNSRSPAQGRKLTYHERRGLERVSRWRTSLRRTESPTSPLTPRADGANIADGPSPPPSTPMTPSSGRKRKLREYIEMQEELRDKEDKIAKTTMTVAGGNRSSPSGRTRKL
ncbi:hypothetical protein CKM354_001232800 [Cercospora kikuchii]|uniref:Uncharacterized protein n=1 Tax=Cercospora kikuchii TaxID=84275 RepID=A0A9P3FLS7_9PEZI|nr:uncharacterized protein CKM354_001232800 [Cercospora kikuchii]GIZ49296.1 hypothetical protein CKM354_001232800 [Cercospora kikuchii]